MFYEMRDKRYDSAGSSGCLGRCWVLVALCGLFITVSFIGMTLWLGMNSRPDVPPIAPHHHHHHQQSQPTHVPSNVHRHHYETTTTKSTFPAVDYEVMPTTSIKNKKGRIEIVEQEKTAKIEPTTPMYRIEPKLGDGINPVEDNSDVSSSTNGVRKKSEVVFPQWSDLESKAEELYEPPQEYPPYYVNEQQDSSQLSPIPAFSYLKEHPVRLTGKDIRPPVEIDSEEYPFYYTQFENAVPENKETNPVFSFLRKRLQDVHDWLAQTGNNRVKNKNNQWIQMVDAVNQSLHTKNATIVLSKLREMYFNSTSDLAPDTPVASLIYPVAANDSTASLVSFGLLAIDLFLLHNVQQIAVNEDAVAGQQMLNDPDVVAMNALFLPPDRVKQLRSANSRVLSDNRGNKGFISELMEFVNSGLRAILNLSRAYRSSSRSFSAQGKSVDGGAPVSGSSLDCIWTLYCRNLDKTARLEGPYGFLAKMNSLGLRLMMGEFPVERALDHLLKESTQGWRRLNCDRLFPRCNGEKAKEVVLETALGKNASGGDLVSL
ncbi:uncharacterized protein LOC126907370 [Daktulosphaira vitifoliae]|uniref:uncharacterized protein LOC126907370 n=1 Tax=Daktulosphaira vitifoliae TaxID=58002 RepID=UPI0021AA82AC|nr:uncharacterized protein LOC126907370 [Daktulosphaira vitifoliae]